ncbi:MAG: DUF4035 domain-containing protein [Marivivens sp.]|nr:DUF4035 domain-containing protein [Marivivens sp.]
MSSSDVAEAMAYCSIEPFGEWREDYRAALICSVLANIHSGTKSKKFSAKDFMPEFGKVQEDKQLVNDIKEALSIG